MNLQGDMPSFFFISLEKLGGHAAKFFGAFLHAPFRPAFPGELLPLMRIWFLSSGYFLGGICFREKALLPSAQINFRSPKDYLVL